MDGAVYEVPHPLNPGTGQVIRHSISKPYVCNIYKHEFRAGPKKSRKSKSTNAGYSLTLVENVLPVQIGFHRLCVLFSFSALNESKCLRTNYTIWSKIEGPKSFFGRKSYVDSYSVRDASLGVVAYATPYE